MIELPEAVTIAKQIEATLSGKRVSWAVANASPHKFAWYSGDPAEYNARLVGKVIGNASAFANLIEFQAGDMQLSICAPIRYHEAGAPRPKKHQLLIEFDDGTGISSSAQMWGGFFCYPVGTKAGFADADANRQKPSPLTDAFDRAYFATLWNDETPKLSTKAFLATEQRIPGLGNGVLQDILWAARLHPRRKMGTLTAREADAMFAAVKELLATMAAQGGRDTEKDLFGRWGGYRTVLSANTAGQPCPACGATILKEPYLGGSVYYCPICQPL